MSRYEKLLNMLMDFDGSVEFAVISDTTGEILWNSSRSNLKLKVPLAETKKILKRESSDWIDRCKAEDRLGLGRALYHITSFQKIKQVTIPVDAFHLLYIVVNNDCLLYTSPSPRDVEESRMPSSA